MTFNANLQVGQVRIFGDRLSSCSPAVGAMRSVWPRSRLLRYWAMIFEISFAIMLVITLPASYALLTSLATKRAI
ncbi:hypothetical protein V2G26_007367 [Clonostachys chloroleuca]